MGNLLTQARFEMGINDNLPSIACYGVDLREIFEQEMQMRDARSASHVQVRRVLQSYQRISALTHGHSSYG